MTREGRSGNRCLLRKAMVVLVAIIGLVAPSYSALMKSSIKVRSVEIAGASGAANNVAFFGKYALVAAFAPSVELGEDETPDKLDNNSLYIVDTTDPDSEPYKASLGNCYYPRAALFDPDRQIVFVRGTQYEVLEDGEIQSSEVVSYLKLNLDSEGKPLADPAPVVFRIPDVEGSSYTSEASNDMALARGGKYLLFTNGAEVSTYNIDEGLVYRVHIVPADKFGPENEVSFAGFDPNTDTLTVLRSFRRETDEGEVVRGSELFFYQIEDSGVVKSVKIIRPEGFPEGGYLPAGSKVAIRGDDETGAAKSGYLVASDGVLYEVDLRISEEGGGLEGSLRPLEHFDTLAVVDPDSAGPRIVQFDSVNRSVWVLQPGNVVVNIRRPVFGRRGGIRRPVFVHAVERPVVLVAQLNRKNKVVGHIEVSEPFQDELGVSGLVLRESGDALLSTRTGKLFSIAVSDGVGEVSLELMGEMGSRLDYLTYNLAENKIVALNSFEMDEEEQRIAYPGALVIATKREGKKSLVALSISRIFAPSGLAALTGAMTSIRRPCNVGR